MEKKTRSETVANKDKFSSKIGDKIEKFGRKVSAKGATKVGNAISRAGDKIEHLKDNK